MGRHLILCRYLWFENSPHIVIFCVFLSFILNYNYLCVPWWHTGFYNPILLKFTNFHNNKIWILLIKTSWFSSNRFAFSWNSWEQGRFNYISSFQGKIGTCAFHNEFWQLTAIFKCNFEMTILKFLFKNITAEVIHDSQTNRSI